MADFIDDIIEQGALTCTTTVEAENNCRFTLEGPKGSFSRTLTMAPGAPPPKIGQILYFYGQYFQPVYSTDDVAEWAEEMDKDLSDWKVLDEYRDLVNDETAFRRCLGDEAYQALMAGLEIHQAIQNARPR